MKEKNKWVKSFERIENKINEIIPKEIKSKINEISERIRIKINNKTTYLAITLFNKDENSKEYKEGIKLRAEEIINTVRESIKKRELV